MSGRSQRSPIGSRRADGGFQADQIIREDYWVEVAGQDSDNSGTNDRVHVEIARPESTDGADAQLPVVVEPSPYYGGFNEAPTNDVEVELYTPDEESTGTTDEPTGDVVGLSEDEMVEFTGKSADFIGPSGYEEEFIDQGYVWAYAASVGTERSTGCLDTGGQHEIDGLEAVVDWFNGRADGYETKVGGSPVEADWTNGKTGMIGASYNGTLPNAVASRGVDGLETIVPHVAISSWYSYYRMNGHIISPQGDPQGSYSWGGDVDWLQQAVLADPSDCEQVTEQLREGQDRKTADYNDFWAERDYVTDAANVEASVLLTHGLYDYNVKLRNAARWLDALDDNDVPYKVWLHQGGHNDPLQMGNRDQWVDLLTDWFAYWLKDEDNGVMDRPTAWVQRENTDGPLETGEDWPAPDSDPVPVEFATGGRQAGGLTLDSDAGGVTETLEDNARATESASVFTYADLNQSPNRLRYQTAELQESVRLSGTPEASLQLAFDREAAIVSVALVDYGPDGSPDIINWGWANPHNRTTLEDSNPIDTGTPYDLTFPMQPVDHVFEAGHRIGLVVYATDVHFTLRPVDDDRTLTLSVGESAVDLPVVGGRTKLATALGEELPDVVVSANGDTISRGGQAEISVPAENVETVTVDDLWTDWQVAGAALRGGSARESEGTYEISWPNVQNDVTPSLQLVLPEDTYVGGEYVLTVSGTDGNDTDSTTTTIQIQDGDAP